MDEVTKKTVLAMADAILQLDMNPNYQVSNADYAKVKAAKQKAMTVKAMLCSTTSVIDDEVGGMLMGYRVADVNAAISAYNAKQDKFAVRPVALGEQAITSSPAPRVWKSGIAVLRNVCELRRPDEPDYKSLT